MKQLKFFTDQANTLAATEQALCKNGIDARHVHVFARDNVHHRFDGLILESEQLQEEESFNHGLILLVVSVMLGVLALFFQWINFLQLAVIVTIISFLPSVFKFLSKSKAKKLEKIKKVYFLVVDVEDDNIDRVNHIAKAQGGLLAQ